MNTAYLPGQSLPYDGRQLTPHWIYQHFDLLGNAIVAFQGICDVSIQELVDLADVKAKAPIYSPNMLHCIVEFFDNNLELAVYRQRLLVIIAKELLEELTEWSVQRQGDDLYLVRPDGTRGKLSVSIATSSVISTLIHTGFNIETNGTPVPTVGLGELDLDIDHFAYRLLERYAAEIEDVWLARCKVRAV